MEAVNMGANLRICAVIPAFNESRSLGQVIREAAQYVEQIIVVDDGSADDTARVAAEAGAQVRRHERNRGKGASLSDGLDWAAEQGFDAAISLDADGQHMPREIPRFRQAASDADMVIGNRMTERRNMPFVRWNTNRFMSWLVSRLAGVRLYDSQCGFRLIKTSAWQSLEVKSCNFDFESEILVAAGRAGMRIVPVPISTVYAGEKSKIKPVTDTVRFFRMVWRLWREA